MFVCSSIDEALILTQKEEMRKKIERIFVIGGGCSNASDLYFHNVIRYYQTMVHEKMQDVPIVKAVLAEPGVVGAAMLVKSNLKK